MFVGHAGYFKAHLSRTGERRPDNMQDVKPSEAVYEYYQKYSWTTIQFDACC